MNPTLQAKLNQGNKRASKLWKGLGAAAVLAICFFSGVFLNQGSAVDPLAVDQPANNKMEGTPEQATAREQYRMALLDSNGNDINAKTKWEAVGYYFPRDKSESNRLYTGLAQVQLARITLENENLQEAKRYVDDVIRDDKMPSVVIALAHLQEACIDEKRGSEQGVVRSVDSAYQRLLSGNATVEQDKRMLNAAVEYMPQSIREKWQAKFN